MSREIRIPKHRVPTGPGEILEEEFRKELGLTQEQFANALGIDRPTYNMIVKGRRRITPDMAMRLSIVLGVSPQTWLNLQMSVDLYQAKQSARMTMLRKELKPLVRIRA
jgi:addiction module HigA family antidote